MMTGGRGHRASPRRGRAALLLLACGLAGCGGGGDGGGGGEEVVKAWSAPEQISFANGNAFAPAVAVDASGIATAAFPDASGPGNWVIAANRFVPGNSWGSPQGISTASTSADLSSVDIATGPSGEVVVVWKQAVIDAWGNNWTPGAGWGTPDLLDGTGLSIGAVRVALDASGAGMAVWMEQPGSPNEQDILRGRAYSPGAGWGSLFSIFRLQETRILSGPVIAAQPDGRTYVAWSQMFNSGVSLFASWSDSRPPSTWNTEFADTLSRPARNPDLAVTASGTAFLVWDQADEPPAPLPLRIWARRRLDSNLARRLGSAASAQRRQRRRCGAPPRGRR